jgi:arylsulfatase A-like enzyme/tetratricopeptide (TPR) repeat protein
MDPPSSRCFRRFATLSLLSLAVACGRGKGPSGGSTSPGAPIVLVSIDTLRADHLPAYGYRGLFTPHIDALRADAILFKNAYTHCPLTLPAHASLLTGLLPPEHGVRNNIGYRLDGQAHPTLVTLLKAQGYATGAAVSAYVLRRTTGLDAGFDAYNEVVTAVGAKAAGEVQRAGSETVRIALDWLRSVGDRRFLLFVHLYEPHTPYEPPEPFRSRYGASYDGEIAAADAALGGLVAGLRQLGLYERALIVLVSDHGEGLGDHGEAEHGILLYREALHVPLLVKLPQSERRGVTDDTPAGLRDVVPTLAAILGLPTPAGMHGRNLLGPGGAEVAAIYSETYYPRIHLGWSELRSLVDARYHFIDGPRPELYDIIGDPAERNDAAAVRGGLARSMQQALESGPGGFAGPAPASTEEREGLKSLGYLTGGAAPAAPGASLPNPRDQIGSYAKMRAAFALVAQGHDAEAVRVLDEILKANPRLVDARVERAAALGRLGRYRDAEKAYLEAIEMAPALAPTLSLTLGRVHLEMGSLAEAAAAARRAVNSEPGPAHELLASVALAGEHLDEAEREARLVVSDAGAQARAAVVLAEVFARRGQHAQALDYLEETGRRNAALGLGPVPYFEFVRGDVLARLGRHAEAEAALRAEIQAFPTHARAYASLAIVTALQGRPLEESRRILEEMHRIQPRQQTALLAAKALDFIGDASGADAWRRRAARPASESKRPT